MSSKELKNYREKKGQLKEMCIRSQLVKVTIEGGKKRRREKKEEPLTEF